MSLRAPQPAPWRASGRPSPNSAPRTWEPIVSWTPALRGSGQLTAAARLRQRPAICEHCCRQQAEQPREQLFRGGCLAEEQLRSSSASYWGPAGGL